MNNRATTTRPSSVITEREQQILELLAQGLPIKAIALHLGIHEQTAKKHLTHVYRKLNVSCNVSAVVTCIRNGLIRL